VEVELHSFSNSKLHGVSFTSRPLKSRRQSPQFLVGKLPDDSQKLSGEIESCMSGENNKQKSYCCFVQLSITLEVSCRHNYSKRSRLKKLVFIIFAYLEGYLTSFKIHTYADKGIIAKAVPLQAWRVPGS